MDMFKKTRYIFLGAMIGAAVMGVAAYATMALGAGDWSRFLPFSEKDLLIMRQARSIIETYHVDDEKAPTEEELFYGSMRGMVAAVKDPYTRYVDPSDLTEEQMEIEGQYGGLGMYVGTRDSKLLVISPIEETPADRAGVKALDEIVKVDEKVVIGMDQEEVVKMLRGEPNTEITVWMRRKDEDELLSFTMVREIIKIKTVRSEMMGEREKIGYIKLNSFHQRSAEELRAAVSKLIEDGARGLVLDMRNNPGGLLNVAVDVASVFLDGGLVVEIKGRVRRFDDQLYAARGTAFDIPMVVLINEGSASASEIVAGAIKDRGRAPVVGKKSYGKGSVQSLFTLPDDSGVYVTIAKYSTPSGYMIDRVGLEPDHEVEPGKDGEDDPQLKRALELLEGVSSAASSGR